MPSKVSGIRQACTAAQAGHPVDQAPKAPHHVLVAPPWIKGVHWSDRSVSIDMTCAAIKAAPAYETGADWSREQEINLHRPHDRKGYWS
jgi:hypothetical protein